MYSFLLTAGTLQKDQKPIWSDIDKLDQSRHLTIYDDKSYMPADLKVSAIQVINLGVLCKNLVIILIVQQRSKHQFYSWQKY